MKRVKHITINLTEEEAELINRIAEEEERKPADLARVLLMRQARQQWATMQPQGTPLTRPKFGN